MSQNAPSSLLPAGLYDLLPPFAAHERYVTGKLLDVFEWFGYAQISPPLMEFEASLLAGRGAALAAQTFRVMDPMSQEMLGFRPDITMQVARVAAVRLADESRPLRLCYNGSTLRVKSEGKQPARQHRQAGIELIGSATPEADAEVMAVAAQALAALGCNDLVVDINLPGMVHAILQSANVPEADRAVIYAAVESKDTGAIAELKLGKTGALLTALMQATGDLQKALTAIDALELPKEAATQLTHVRQIAAHWQKLGGAAKLTLDPVENRGFEYHSAVSFTLFSTSGNGGELGRGGRYVIAGSGEAATGITLYVNTLMDVVAAAKPAECVEVARDASLAECEKLHAQGKATRWTNK